jgi:hypothetical protein
LAYAKFMGHHRLDEPVPCQKDIGLGGDGLWELEEEAGSLGQTLCREKDGVLEFDGEGAVRAALE